MLCRRQGATLSEGVGPARVDIDIVAEYCPDPFAEGGGGAAEVHGEQLLRCGPGDLPRGLVRTVRGQIRHQDHTAQALERGRR